MSEVRSCNTGSCSSSSSFVVCCSSSSRGTSRRIINSNSDGDREIVVVGVDAEVVVAVGAPVLLTVITTIVKIHREKKNISIS